LLWIDETGLSSQFGTGLTHPRVSTSIISSKAQANLYSSSLASPPPLCCVLSASYQATRICCSCELLRLGIF
jgi:hypothetical protein